MTEEYFEAVFWAVLYFLNGVKTWMLKRNLFSTCRNPEIVLGVKSGAAKNDHMSDVNT